MKQLIYLVVGVFLTTIPTVWGQTTLLQAAGLEKPVEILVDEWGVPHIYAQTEADLFFAQGYYAARDRLFQFELWRRQATGTVAEILGARELKRDIGTRLFQFRGNIEDEMNHYHPRGSLIITSFVRGVNAAIAEANTHPEDLPIEFQLLGIRPQPFTPEVIISRHQGLLGNIGDELSTGRAVALIGPDKVKELQWFHPQDPQLTLDPKIPADLLSKDILELYNAYRRPVRFQPEDLVAYQVRNDRKNFEALAQIDEQEEEEIRRHGRSFIGSNNWIVSGALSQSGYPMLANDPHRAISAPSLRYMAHLVGPGWNVIGGGEPTIPGISIGHNEHGAWGLTVFATDAEDLYVYETNPANSNQYRYQGRWENMRIVRDTIAVKGQDPVVVELKYTRHGPVVFEEKGRNTAFAVRCGWLEVGGAPYLASLRMDQAKNWEEFRQACNYSHIPGENMIWADRAGNIGWQAVGIAPLRRNWSGLVPVPGDGRYEWDGYLPIVEKPSVLNPPAGYFVTANANVTPPDYQNWDAIGYEWSDPFRGDRIREYLGSGRRQTLADFMSLQTDYLSLPARSLTALLRNVVSPEVPTENARQQLLAWNCELRKESIPATIYNAWEREIIQQAQGRFIPDAARPFLSLQLKQIIDWLVLPDRRFGDDPILGRNEFLLSTLSDALRSIEEKLGKNQKGWQYGQLNNKYVLIRHPMSNAVSPAIREQLDVGPAPRGGNGFTANVTGRGDNQTSGASFRLIVDTENWDHCVATNTPGQAGNPKDPHYANLFPIWVNDQYFPLFYSRKKVESVTFGRIDLTPKK